MTTELFQQTKDIFSFIKQQKNLQLDIIGLIKGIDKKSSFISMDPCLSHSINYLAEELKKSVESQKKMECNLNSYICCMESLMKKEISRSNSPCNTVPHNGINYNESNIKSLSSIHKEIQCNSIKNIPVLNNSPCSNRITTTEPVNILCEDVASRTSQKSIDCSSVNRIPNVCHYKSLRCDFGSISKPCIFIYVLENLSEKFAKDIEIWSDPFYTSHIGYKMKVKIGFSPDYLGVYVKLVEGDFDNLLAWPFTNEISFTLMNQITEGDDVTKILKPHPMDCDEQGYWIKPKFADICLSGWGFNDFVDIKCIKGPQDDFVSDYVRNDRLYVKVKLV